ncbi:MAG: glycosyltransferase family 4 protein [Planctomycetes bacterium]|nr:glycosyltransferase family 4 protein [Planctomycetota bacterium]
MRVALIIERTDITLGGAERSIAELSEALALKGLDVTILAAKGEPYIANTQILCPDSGRKRATFTEFETLLKTHLAQHHYDIVHSVLPFSFADVYQPRGGTYRETILRSALSYENRSIAWLKRLGAFVNHRRQQLMTAELSLSRNPEGPKIVAISQYVSDQFRTHYDTDPARIVLIANGVKTGDAVDEEARQQIRRDMLAQFRCRPPETALLLLFAAYNFRLKGLGPLLHAMALVKQTQACCLSIVGKGHSAEAYEETAERLDIGDQVCFMGSVDRLQGFLAAADVAILPTFYDPASRFVLEALALAKPVITTHYNGATDLFVHARHGFIIHDPGDVRALAHAIRSMSDPGRLRKMSAAITADGITERVSIKRVAAQLIRLYETILRQKGRVACSLSAASR